MDLKTAFNTKLTENGDLAFKSTGDPVVDMVFFAPYLNKHLDVAGNLFDKVPDDTKPVLAMFVRDPRFGLKWKDLGRYLCMRCGLSPALITTVGSYKDLWKIAYSGEAGEGYATECLMWLKEGIVSGNGLAKKWAPKFSSKKNLQYAVKFAKMLGMTKMEYGKFVKNPDTVEYKLSHKETDRIEFEKVPSLALKKYWSRFKNGSDTSEKFGKYIGDVQAGTKKINTAVLTPYDVYKSDASSRDLLFDKLEKFKCSMMPIVDTSWSMYDKYDSYGKAIAIGHYIANCSEYLPKTVVSFSSSPRLLELGDGDYASQIRKMYTGDCSNTDFSKVLKLLEKVSPGSLPDYFLVLTDMEFDCGSYIAREALENKWKAMGVKTKLIWWNFNSREMTAPETTANGHIFMSGYSPEMLKFLNPGFDAKSYVKELLDKYMEKLVDKLK